MMKTGKKPVLLILSAAVLFFSGCLGRNAEVYGQRHVLDYVDSVCSEPYELLGRELIEEDPDNMEYYFRTLDRDLDFQANSYLSPVWIDATETSFYTREISCDYVQTVHGLYRNETKAILEEDSRYLEDFGWMYLLSFGDIEQAADTLLKADQVYSRELEYNSPEFLSANPIATVHFVWFPSEAEVLEHDNWVNVTDIGLTGQLEKEQLLSRLSSAYAQLTVDKKITDDSVPEEYLAGKHVSLLETIELNGTEMLYDSEDNPCGIYGMTTDDYKYCWYSRDASSYMMVIDIGLITDRMSFPLIIREYVRNLGGTYEVSAQDDTYTSTWTIDGDTWSLESRFDDNTIQKLEIKKNGQPLNLSYVTVKEDYNVHASFCVGVPVEDFCRLFGLTYRISEDEGKISFISDTAG